MHPETCPQRSAAELRPPESGINRLVGEKTAFGGFIQSTCGLTVSERSGPDKDGQLSGSPT